MALDSVGTTLQTPTSEAGLQGLRQEDFLKILLTQLSFQDPLKPMDNQEFIAQFAQFAGLDQSRQANEKTDSLLTMQAANQALTLLGKTVEVEAGSTTVVGEVTTLSFADGVPNFVIKKSNGSLITGILLSQISIVKS
ncbi:MAG: flagellar hook capping FlgD N-terminal domain-containing protein [Candidatus Sedimenticola sp. (ex Thyasira tokunagai)]